MKDIRHENCIFRLGHIGSRRKREREREVFYPKERGRENERARESERERERESEREGERGRERYVTRH